MCRVSWWYKLSSMTKAMSSWSAIKYLSHKNFTLKASNSLLVTPSTNWMPVWILTRVTHQHKQPRLSSNISFSLPLMSMAHSWLLIPDYFRFLPLFLILFNLCSHNHTLQTLSNVSCGSPKLSAVSIVHCFRFYCIWGYFSFSLTFTYPILYISLQPMLDSHHSSHQTISDASHSSLLLTCTSTASAYIMFLFITFTNIFRYLILQLLSVFNSFCTHYIHLQTHLLSFHPFFTYVNFPIPSGALPACPNSIYKIIWPSREHYLHVCYFKLSIHQATALFNVSCFIYSFQCTHNTRGEYNPTCFTLLPFDRSHWYIYRYQQTYPYPCHEQQIPTNSWITHRYSRIYPWIYPWITLIWFAFRWFVDECMCLHGYQAIIHMDYPHPCYCQIEIKVNLLKKTFYW